jgi:hypothetical protein
LPSTGRPTPSCVGDRADEVVLDAAAPLSECRVQVREMLARADEDRTAAKSRDAEDVLRQDVVARAQHADEDRGEEQRRREDRVRREPVARADAEREREHGDEDERRHDAAEAAAILAPCVETVPPEDEHRQQREEGQPLRLRVAPDQPPQDRPRACDVLAQGERRVHAEREPAEIEREQRGNARAAARGSFERPAREDVRPAGANVLGKGVLGRRCLERFRGQGQDSTRD